MDGNVIQNLFSLKHKNVLRCPCDSWATLIYPPCCVCGCVTAACSHYPVPWWWYLLISGSESAPCPHLHLITCLCLRTPGLVIVMLASAEAETQLQDTGDTGSYRHTQSYAVFSSIPSIQQRSALVCSAVFTAIKCLIFPENIAGYLILPAELHCITLYTYLYLLFGFGNIYWLDNKQLQQRLFKWISIKLHRYFYWLKYRYVEMMSDIIV